MLYKYIYISKISIYGKKIALHFKLNDQEIVIVEWMAKWTRLLDVCNRLYFHTSISPPVKWNKNKSGVLCIIMLVCLFTHSLPVTMGMKGLKRGLRLEGCLSERGLLLGKGRTREAGCKGSWSMHKSLGHGRAPSLGLSLQGCCTSSPTSTLTPTHHMNPSFKTTPVPQNIIPSCFYQPFVFHRHAMYS